MDSSLLAPSLDQTSTTTHSFDISQLGQENPFQTADSLVIASSLVPANSDAVDTSSVSFEDLYKGLSITAQKLVDKLNELLKDKLPNGIQSLKPEDVTSDATAENIVNGATAFYDVFAKQNPNLEGEDLLNKFLETIKSGIQQGYDDAYQTLDGLGAFQFDGVKSSVEETKVLIEEKLKAFEDFKRQELGLPAKDGSNADIATSVSKSTDQNILASSEVKVLRIAA